MRKNIINIVIYVNMYKTVLNIISLKFKTRVKKT